MAKVQNVKVKEVAPGLFYGYADSIEGPLRSEGSSKEEAEGKLKAICIGLGLPWPVEEAPAAKAEEPKKEEKLESEPAVEPKKGKSKPKKVSGK